jgi:ABC-2 type transport system permease protein
LLINSTFSFILGGLGFWLTEIWGLTAIRVLAIGVLSGTVFPLDILPDSVQKIFLYSPFPYLSYVPSQILLGREVAGISSTWAILIALSWLCFFAVVMYFVWKKGLEKYTAVGV